MSTVIQIKDIDDVLANLSYTNPGTQKYKLVQAIRRFYDSEDASDFPKEIDAVELVRTLWETGEDPDLIKSKKKNLSSTKSAVNADLKKLYQGGGNPSGIIIGRNNIFDLSEEAKNKALTQLAESLRGAKEGLIGKIAEVLETINQHLSNPEALSEQGPDDGLNKLDVIKQLVLDLNRKIGLPQGDMTGAGLDRGAGSSLMDSLIHNAVRTTGGGDDFSEGRPVETLDACEAADPAVRDDVEVVESDDDYEDILTDDALEAYDEEKAREAAWQDLELDDATASDVSLEEAFPEAEDVMVETAADEPLEAAAEIVEEIVGEDLPEEPEELIEVEAAAGPEDGVGASGEAAQEPMPDEGLEITDSDAAAEGASPETEDVMVEAAADEPLEAAAEIVEEIVGEDLPEEPEELIEVEAAAGPEDGAGASEEAAQEPMPDEGLEITDSDAAAEGASPETEDVMTEAAADEPLEAAAEIVEEIVGEDLPEELEELIEVEAAAGPEDGAGASEEAAQEMDGNITDPAADESLEATEEVADEALTEESEELLEEVADEDLQSTAEALANLAEAAKILEKLGPDFNDSIYSEKEIKEKAKSLSEEFDRHLAIRDKFFNQHVLIKSGTYTIGSKEPKDHEKPEQTIHLPAFYIGKFPITNALFELFVENTGYKTTAERCGYGLVYSSRGRKERDPRTGRERFIWRNSQEYKRVEGACWYHPSGPGSSIHDKKRHPVVQVSVEDARAFAAWTGKRIPSESQWEAAARTRSGYLYPWGNDWKEKACNVEKTYIGDTTPVDQYLESSNGEGLSDTLGNVLEWTLDAWTNPATGAKDPQYYIAKGGSWASNGSLSLNSRFRVAKNTTSNILGFRCVAI